MNELLERIDASKDECQEQIERVEHKVNEAIEYKNVAAGLCVATLNCLGEAFNPFEFCSKTNLAGCETLQDVGHLSSGEVTGLSDENLAKLQGDPRVLAHTRKQEL